MYSSLAIRQLFYEQYLNNPQPFYNQQLNLHSNYILISVTIIRPHPQIIDQLQGHLPLSK